ncbi:MAG: polysaccharide deacetylase family protein [Flavobacteriales bacterium]|nr:polysaccharide deacetylase family protein [Flavobacteriales bacterium]MCX7768950.1 polysaccharide deacetylase family protein [Flavobacteriales bacterium]MDW8411006.1 polysaccharide deacetylase family protein [Flavobacteriales bacterium]
MNIRVAIPPQFTQEREYILEVFFRHYLGLSYTVEYLPEGSEPCWIIRMDDGPEIVVEDHFFSRIPQGRDYREASRIPTTVVRAKLPMTPEEDIPVVYGRPFLEVGAPSVRCGVDIFSSAFFMLSRWEETVLPDRDDYQRFPGSSSVAYKQGFLLRPIVNEYLELLKNMLRSVAPAIQFKKHTFQQRVSCDVDLLRYNHLRKIAGAIIKYRSFKKLKKSLENLRRWKNPLEENMFFIAKLNEGLGQRVEFNIIPLSTGPHDEPINYRSASKRKLLSQLAERGHLIGFHPGFNTSDNPELFAQSVARYRQILENIHYPFSDVGGRQHFLKWSHEITPQLWEAHGFSYDSTLGYADRAGFRCGTCWPFPVFDIFRKKTLRLMEVPLIVMEYTVIKYENLEYSAEALSRFFYLKSVTKKYDGVFTFLWHNSHFETEKDFEFYEAILKA